jgi:hypothetical protein
VAHWLVAKGKTTHVHSDLSRHETTRNIQVVGFHLMGLAAKVQSIVETSCTNCGAIKRDNDSVVRL